MHVDDDDDDFLNAETVPPTPTPTNAVFANIFGLVETKRKESSRAYDFYAKALNLLTCFQCKKRCLMDESAQDMGAFYCSTYETCSMCAQCVCRKCFDEMQEVAIANGKRTLCPSCKAGRYPMGHAGSTILSWLTKKDVVAEKAKPQTFNFGTNTEPPRTQSLALRESTSDEEFAIMRNFYFNALKLLKCAVCKTDCSCNYYACQLCAQCICVGTFGCYRTLSDQQFHCPECKDGTYNLNAVNEKDGGAIQKILRWITAERGTQCTNFHYGCRFRATQREIMFHSTVCNYKPFPCPILFCSSAKNDTLQTGALRPKYHPGCHHDMIARKNVIAHAKSLLRVIDNTFEYLDATFFVHAIDLSWMAAKWTFQQTQTKCPKIKASYRTWSYLVAVSEEKNEYVMINASVDHDFFTISITDLMHAEDDHYVAKIDIVPNMNFGAPYTSKIITSASYERETICDYLAPTPMSHANREKFEENHVVKMCNYERYSNLEEHIKACRFHFTRYIQLIPDGLDEEELYVKIRVQIIAKSESAKLSNQFPDYSWYKDERSAGLMMDTSRNYKWCEDSEIAAIN